MEHMKRMLLKKQDWSAKQKSEAIIKNKKKQQPAQRKTEFYSYHQYPSMVHAS
jgi:hypothetical protein